MTAQKATTAILHYTAPPVVGGVEGVMEAHAAIFLKMGYPVSLIAGQGSEEALPAGAGLALIPELDTQHPRILKAGEAFDAGEVPPDFEALTRQIEESLKPLLKQFDNVIVHNVFTKHFNLPLTAALFNLLDAGSINNCIAWHHDFTWSSPRSRPKVHDGYPWDLLRTYRADVTHVTISQDRKRDLVGLYQCAPEEIRIIYNGVDAAEMFGLGAEGADLVQRLDLLKADLILLMPVRVTKAKNIEYALEVVAALKAEGIKVKLVLTGPPDPHDEQSMGYFHSLQSLRDDLGVHEEMRFVFESGPDAEEPYLIDLSTVAGLYRVADMMLMPSHQEGFGMPVLEAGLLSMPVVASETVPAAAEIGGEDVLHFSLDESPQDLAQRLLQWTEHDHRARLARRTRQYYTWEAIFCNQIQPLLVGKQI